MTSPLVRTYTLQEFWHLPEPADRSTLELIKGVLYMSPPPGEAHDEAFARLNRALIRAIDRAGYGGSVYAPRAAIWTDSATYLEPDLMYVSEALRAEMESSHRTRADIVVEIVSPSSADFDRKTKSDTYQALGVREMWLVDMMARTVEVRSFEGGGTVAFTVGQTLRSQVLPEIDIPVTELFE